MKIRKLLYCLGRPISPFYSLLMRLRAFLYRNGVFRTVRVGVPVVSIGNLTMGGSGKTPVVQYVARFLLEQGMHPAVVSRGYGGTAKGRVNIVSDGSRILLDARTAGDEPRLLAETLKGVPVYTGAARKYPAIHAVEAGADCLVLDDGFQHMALTRDIDLVLFNADFLAGNSTVFPGGDLREGVKSLNRCNGFVITGICTRNKERAEKFKELLQNLFPGHPVFLSQYRASSVLTYDSEGVEKSMSLNILEQSKLYGFSGIAHPENFQETLDELVYSIAGFQPFKDHYFYTDKECQKLISSARASGAEAFVTTEKDLVKLRSVVLPDFILPVYAIRMEVEFADDFKTYLLSGLSKK